LRWALCCIAFVAAFFSSAATISAEEPAARLTLHMGFGGTVTGLATPGPLAPSTPGPAPACPKPLTTAQPVLFSLVSPPIELCFNATPDGLGVQFYLPAVPPVNFEYPRKLSCVTLKPRDEQDVMVKVQVTVNDARIPVECDITRSFLYTLAIERHGAIALQNAKSTQAAPAWQSTIEVPWSTLHLHSRESHLKVAVSTNSYATPVASLGIDVTIADRNATLSLLYAPFLHFATPAPSARKPLPRLRDIGADFFYGYDRHTLLAATFAQNDAAATTQRSFSQVLGNAPLPLPGANAAATGPETLITRTQPLLAFLRPSAALGDQDLRLLIDASPFTLGKVGSLAAGYTLGYTSEAGSAAAFYGLQQSGLSNQAYAVTITIPTPAPRATPTPTPAPSPTPKIVQKGVAPPSLPSPGPIEESKTSHDPLATIALLNAVAQNGSYIDNVSGFALGTNFYRNTCATENLYCAYTLHFSGSIQHDGDPRTSSPSVLTPQYASNLKFAGQSGSYTRIFSPAGATPKFAQVAEMVGFQQADRFYSPAAGAVTAFVPLGGAVGHAVLSYGTGQREHIYSVDVLGVRLTSPYGDVFTDVAEQVVLPFDVSSMRGWTLNAGVQSESLSDRVANLQQGLVGSYFSAVFPTVASLNLPAAPAVVRPQNQQNVMLQSPSFDLGKGLAVQLSGGYQQGFVTNCAPAPVKIVCSTGHDHAATWALFANRTPIGFGIATTSSASIPGDLAIASTARYFGSFVNAPGSVTSYVTFTKCLQASADYTNAAYPSGIPLPQQGATVAGKVYYPFHNLGLEAGYFNVRDTQSSTLNQSGFYTLIRFATSFGKAVPAPGCRR
jgi:hypothetical protein